MVFGILVEKNVLDFLFNFWGCFIKFYEEKYYEEYYFEYFFVFYKIFFLIKNRYS